LSNSVSTRVWRGSGHTKTKLLLLVKIADNVNNDAVGFAGRKYLAKNTRISVRQVQRLIDQIQETGELYVRPGNGRGNETLALITIGLNHEGIKRRLIDYFEMSPFDAENVSLSIMQKGDIFKQKRETKSTKKGDIVERKSGTTVLTSNTLTSNTKTLAVEVQPPADPIPPKVDPIDPEPPMLKEVFKTPSKVPAKISPAKLPQYGDLFVLVHRYGFKAAPDKASKGRAGKATIALLEDYPDTTINEFNRFADDWKCKKGQPDFPKGTDTLPSNFGEWKAINGHTSQPNAEAEAERQRRESDELERSIKWDDDGAEDSPGDSSGLPASRRSAA